MSDDAIKPEQEPSEADARAVNMIGILTMNAIFLQNLTLALLASDKKTAAQHLAQFALALQTSQAGRDLLAEVTQFAMDIGITVSLHMTPFDGSGKVH